MVGDENGENAFAKELVRRLIKKDYLVCFKVFLRDIYILEFSKNNFIVISISYVEPDYDGMYVALFVI